MKPLMIPFRFVCVYSSMFTQGLGHLPRHISECVSTVRRLTPVAQDEAAGSRATVSLLCSRTMPSTATLSPVKGCLQHIDLSSVLRAG